ncbi:hypothetical protein RYX36_003857, partial [Vicia faba]
IDPRNRYANYNTILFDVSMRALDGLQGPMKKIKLFLRKPKLSKKEEDEVCLPINCDRNNDNAYIESLLLPKRFGNSTSLAASIPIAEYQGRLLQDSKGNETQGRPVCSFVVPREPLDVAIV